VNVSVNLFRKFFTVCLIIALVVGGGMQARRALKREKARRLVAEAKVHLQSKDLIAASRCLKAALAANYKSVEATRLTADMLENAGSWTAIDWRIRSVQLQPTNMTTRLDWAQTAVKLGDAKSAEDALSGLEEDAKNSAQYHKVAGALAWIQGRRDQAEQHYQKALQLEPKNPSNVLNLGTIGLISTNVDVAAAARKSLQALAATNELRGLEALRLLALEATKRKNIPEALAYTCRFATNPAATIDDKIDHLNLLKVAEKPEVSSWLSTLKQQATNSANDVFVLGRWLSRTEGPTNALAWLLSLPQAVQTNRPVALFISDSQVVTKDWNGLLNTVGQKDWGESEVMRLAFESLARRSLGQTNEADTLWKRARRQSARHLYRLYHLVQQSTAWGWAPERREVLTEIVFEFPRELWALDLLVKQLVESGATEDLQQLVYKLSVADPSNVKLKASLARLSLLRKNQLPNAHRLAKEAYDRVQDDPLILSTYAYSLLIQGRQNEAVQVLDRLKPQELQIPWVATCYGVIEAKSGNKQAAHEPLERAKSAKLLPEEIELVRQASAN
jgi:predicted Zn-dependent protease